MRVRAEGPQLISQMVSRILGIDCSVLMGANIAGDIANEEVRSKGLVFVCQEGGGVRVLRLKGLEPGGEVRVLCLNQRRASLRTMEPREGRRCCCDR